MKILKSGRIAMALALAVSAAAAREAGAGERTLQIYTWSDYFAPAVIENFEKRFNCRVRISIFESNEDLHEKLESGAVAHDILTPSSYMSSVLWDQGLILALNPNLIPNLANIDRSFTSLTRDPDMLYSVPYTRTVTGIGYNAREVPPEALGSWNIFSRPALAGGVTMLDDMRESIGAALKYLGHSLNSVDQEEIDAAVRVILGWKKNLAGFAVDDATTGLESGELLAIHAYNGDVAMIMEGNPDLAFFVPREGTSVTADDFVIQAISPSPELAHAFINYLLEPETAVANMESIHYYMPNPRALEKVDPALKANPAFSIDERMLANCEVIEDLGDDNALYARAWDKIKAEE
jgi:spermidine/putrescine transport system substrate-binding protein